jgi:nicotinamidase/pyrazinamidase
VAGTSGAQFHADLVVPDDALIVTKGVSPSADDYSVFEGRMESGVSFERDLKQRRVTHLWVGGLATDYCVRQSALDLLHAEFDVSVLSDAIARIDLTCGDSERSLDEMQKAGARLATVAEVVKRHDDQLPVNGLGPPLKV